MTGEHGNSIRNTLYNNLKKQNIKLFLKHHVINTVRGARYIGMYAQLQRFKDRGCKLEVSLGYRVRSFL